MTDHSFRGRVVLLNGPPSSGKTSLARALVAVLDEPWFHRSLNDFRSGYRDEFWQRDEGGLFDRVMRGYVEALRAMAIVGNDVIAEAVITPDRRNLYTGAFEGLPLTVVAVRCPLEIARRRERSRKDRLGGPIELPPAAFAAVYDIHHDLEVDTSTGSPEAIAHRLAPRVSP